MDLDDVRAFVSVLETGSLVSSARQLRIPRATLRRRIEALEARVGVPLLIRTSAGVRPTPAGAQLAEGGRALLQQGGALIERAREAGNMPQGVLRVLVPHGLPTAPQTLIAAQVAQHPGMQLEIHYAADPLQELGTDVDIAVHFGTAIPEGPWLSYPLMPLHERLLASEAYLAEHGEPTLERLAEHRILRYACAECPRTSLPLKSGGSVEIRPWLVAADVLALRWLAHQGLGIAYVPDAGVPIPNDPTSGLVPVLTEQIGRATGLRLVIPVALHGLPKVQVARELVQMAIGDLPGPDDTNERSGNTP